MNQVVSLLIVEDEPLWSDLLARTLSAEPGLQVLGITRRGEDAVRMAAEMTPDAVLMDIELAGQMDGIEAALKIKEARPQTGIVILSSHNDRRYVASLPLGEKPGWSYLLKQTAPDISTVVRAVQASVSGMVMLDPAVVASLTPRASSRLARLTARQLEVLKCIGQGYNNAAIADLLVITERAVEAHINAIYQELELTGESGVHQRVRATLLFLEESLAQPGNPPARPRRGSST